MVDVVAEFHSFCISHRVGIHHFSVDGNRVVELRDDEDVVVLQHEVIAVRAGMFECFFQIDAHGSGVTDFKFFHIDGVSAEGELQHVELLCFFSRRQFAFQMSAHGVGLLRQSARSLHQITQTHAFRGEDIGTGEIDFAAHMDVFLLHVARRASHKDFVKGFQFKAGCTVHHEAFFKFETIGLSHF